MRIALLGDAMLGRKVGNELRSRAPESVWSTELRELALGWDIVVCNLECCISRRGWPTSAIPRKGFFFRAPAAAVAALRALGVCAVSLANNHALDYGEEALADTVELLGQAGIATAGAGLGPEAARRGAIANVGDARVGLLAVTDHPREYTAQPGTWGVAFADLRHEFPDWVGSELERLQHETDAVIAFPHWGPNMSTEPAPWQRTRAAELLAGANFVAGHSAHVFHGVERHPGGFAAYDLGGAVDDYAVDPALRNDLGLVAVWTPDGEGDLELIGLRLHYGYTEVAEGEDADWIAARLAAACGQLGTAVQRVADGRHLVS
jgi:poly-gamma-glutamate capsule biosynthesis protein CapA/YwtB (metallophosphatase superfamily)